MYASTASLPAASKSLLARVSAVSVST